MKDVRTRIQHMAKLLKIVCIALEAVMIISALIVASGMMATLSGVQAVGPLPLNDFDTGLIEELNGLHFLEDMDPRSGMLVGGSIHIVTRIALLFYLIQFHKMFGYVADGNRPFDMSIAKRLRWMSLLTLLFVFFNPLMGILVFLTGLFFSGLFEYGSFLQDKADETNRIQEEMIISFAEITENKSEQTGQHVKRVSEYSKILAEEMGMDADRVEKIRLASTMHDLGKLLIPAEILEKPAKLTDEEFAEIKKHPGYGGALLNSVEGDVMGLAKTIALEHHERADGKGYPAGKLDESISPEGRIVAVADVYDALTSKRSYKEAWDEKDAYDEIVKGRGTQFDAEVVDAFIKAYPKFLEVRQTFADKAV